MNKKQLELLNVKYWDVYRDGFTHEDFLDLIEILMEPEIPMRSKLLANKEKGEE